MLLIISVEALASAFECRRKMQRVVNLIAHAPQVGAERDGCCIVLLGQVDDFKPVG